MFSSTVDNEIKLALIEKSFAPLYVELAKENYTALERWLAWPPHCKSEQDFVSFIQKSLHDYADNKSMVCAVWFNEKLVGNVSFNTINHDLKKVDIGYWLAESAQGKGIMTRVCKKLINIAFSELNMHKIEISAASGNLASRAVCERLGMTLEGIVTNSENLNGRIVDHAVYGLHRT
ncbi:GNAT family N-acetyltransferase [Psychromonas ossibalaenae]|uniref:GNAT family N-acetyltransferase n=1 Tax=Psychromonas ossibalaenae TaxID=444922 RepID=UPI00035C1A7C|nr:GNAT family protein [Psychromonas ossibalaenae]